MRFYNTLDLKIKNTSMCSAHYQMPIKSEVFKREKENNFWTISTICLRPSTDVNSVTSLTILRQLPSKGHKTIDERIALSVGLPQLDHRWP